MNTLVDENTLADRLNVSVHTLRRNRMKEDGIPYYKLSGQRSAVRYDLSKVLEYLEGNKKK
jgi:hypothetical protein